MLIMSNLDFNISFTFTYGLHKQQQITMTTTARAPSAAPTIHHCIAGYSCSSWSAHSNIKPMKVNQRHIRVPVTKKCSSWMLDDGVNDYIIKFTVTEAFLHCEKWKLFKYQFKGSRMLLFDETVSYLGFCSMWFDQWHLSDTSNRFDCLLGRNIDPGGHKIPTVTQKKLNVVSG